jgi:hypothetical protein
MYGQKFYPIPNQTLNILTPPNETYVQRKGETVITTTAGIWGNLDSIKIFNQGTTKVKNAEDVAQIMSLLQNKAVETHLLYILIKSGTYKNCR